MYKIRGGDGNEYGPVSADTLRAWVNQGRANSQTFVLAEGATEWKTLSTHPEFAPLFAPPPPGLTSAIGGSPIGPARTSGMAVWSLVLGILSLICGFLTLLSAPTGLILGLVALSKIKNSEGRLAGRGLALAGAIISGVAILFIPVMAALLLPALAKAKSKATTINCVNNVKQISLGARIYSSDNNDVYPAGTNWCDALNQYVGAAKVYQCPSDAAQLRSGYAFNAKLSGLAEKDVDPRTVMIFESDSGWNASGGKELMIPRPRHGGRYVVGLADGSVQQYTEAQLPQLRWDPKPGTNNNP